VQIVRVTVNLDETTAEQGALQVIPGTHFPQYNRGLFRAFGRFEGAGNRLRLDPHAVPGAVALATRPGDVIVWWNRLWHAAFKRKDGRPRRALFLSYVPDPRDDAALAENLRATVEGIVTSERPCLYAPCLSRSSDANVQAMVERLEALGVMSVRAGVAR
jgi:ectoine hydroxylase-related dioxygenase (phytanoyl-CoA dioxygenase family)